MGRNFTHHWCRVPKCWRGTSDQMGKIQKFWPEESIFLWNFAPRVPKVFILYFLPILAALRLKIPIRYFQPGCNHFLISVLLTNGATNGGGVNKILVLCSVTIHCCYPPSPFSPRLFIYLFILVICVQKIIKT